MEPFFTFFADILKFIISFLPHIRLVDSTQGGIKLRFGNIPVPMTCNNGLWLPDVEDWFKFKRSGLHIYWPILSKVMITAIKRQTKTLPKQMLTTKDGKTIYVSIIIVYEIFDPVKLLYNTWDQDDTIKDYGTYHLSELITESNFDDIMEIDLTEPLKVDLEQFGVNIIRVSFADFATGRPLLHIGMQQEQNHYHSEVAEAS